MEEKLTVEQIAKEYKVDKRTVRKWLQSGLKHVNVGTYLRPKYRIARKDLDEFLEKRSE